MEKPVDMWNILITGSQQKITDKMKSGEFFR